MSISCPLAKKALARHAVPSFLASVEASGGAVLLVDVFDPGPGRQRQPLIRRCGSNGSDSAPPSMDTLSRNTLPGTQELLDPLIEQIRRGAQEPERRRDSSHLRCACHSGTARHWNARIFSKKT
jgi:hypothetical protein